MFCIRCGFVYGGTIVKGCICAISNTGRIRKNNEDNFFVNGIYSKDYKINNFSFESNAELSTMSVVAVFDGMGGNHFGEEASATAAKSLLDYITAANKENVEFNGRMAIRRMNNSVCKVSRKLSARIGTTIVMGVINENILQVFNVGDSRAYLYRNGQLQQLSVDHNEATLYKQMNIEQYSSNAKNILTQHLGIEEEEFVLEPFISKKIMIENDDILLLCSDGLCGLVQDDVIADLLDDNIEKTPLKEKAERLVEIALECGGNDNITVLLVSFK